MLAESYSGKLVLASAKVRFCSELRNDSSITCPWRTSLLKILKTFIYIIYSYRGRFILLKCYLGDRFRGISGKMRLPSAGNGVRLAVYSSLLWLRTLIILAWGSRLGPQTLPVLEYVSSVTVGTFCCDKNCLGLLFGCGNKKFCFWRGEIGRNFELCWWMDSEFIPSGLGNVFWRVISGERFMYCGDVWRFGGDVGSSLTCWSGFGRVDCRMSPCRFGKSGSPMFSGDLLYNIRFGEVGSRIFGRFVYWSGFVFDGNVDCRMNGGYLCCCCCCWCWWCKCWSDSDFSGERL